MTTRSIVSSILVGLLALSFAGCQNNKASMCDPSSCDMKECRDAGKCMGKCEDKACGKDCGKSDAKACGKDCSKDCTKCCGKKAAMSGPAAGETKTVAAVTPAAADATCINTVCPIGGHKLDSDALKVSYKGKTIGLCCPDCIDEMNKMSEAKRDEVLAKASKK
jgi:hypothetical protein